MNELIMLINILMEFLAPHYIMRGTHSLSSVNFSVFSTKEFESFCGFSNNKLFGIKREIIVMKVFVGVLIITLASVQAGLLSHHHTDEIADHGHYVDHGVHHGVDVHHANGVHIGHSSAIVIDGDHVTEHHPVYHHDGNQVAGVDVVQTDVGGAGAGGVDVALAGTSAARVIHHEPIHQVESVHHVTRVVHHEPHHFLHYTNPVVDHHVVHQNHHVDEHHHAADLHHTELHHGDLLHRGVVHHTAAPAALHHHHGYAYHNNAALVHHAPVAVHHHRNAAVVHRVYPAHPTHADILTFAKHQLHGKYGKVKIIEKHY
uniref:Histidine-rich glycoprotein n=2 Tax=Glossina TaxID=44049 RepID=A0A1A9ZZY5_GLOPL